MENEIRECEVGWINDFLLKDFWTQFDYFAQIIERERGMNDWNIRCGGSVECIVSLGMMPKDWKSCDLIDG